MLLREGSYHPGQTEKQRQAEAWEGKSEQAGDHRMMLLKVCNLGAHSYIYIPLRLLQWEVMQRPRRLTAKPERIGNSCFPQGFD